MQWNKIYAGDHRYISEFMTDFEPGVWNKRVADTGASHLIITNDINYVMVVPNIDLVQSLVKDGKNIFGVYGGINENNYKQFVNYYGQPKKIVTTWDSLYKIVKWIDPQEYQLCVDEYHSVFESLGFRLKAIKQMMDLINQFKNVRYISATPNQEDFEFEVLKELPHYEIIWDNIETISPIMEKSNNTTVSTCMFINKLLDGELEMTDVDGNTTQVKELYIFLNSVKTIEQICSTLDLDPDDVKICCSSKKRNRYILGKYSISDVTDKNKKINFFTSKCFQGCNLYTENGLVLMVADTIQPSLLMDLNTQGAQIAGRIRNTESIKNCFRHIVVYIYKTNNKFTKEELDSLYNSKIEKSLGMIEDYKRGLSLGIQELLENNQDDYFYVIEDGEIYISEDKKAYALYQNQLRLNYRNDFTVISSFNKDKFIKPVTKNWTRWTDETCKQLSSIKMVSYADVVKDYFENQDEEWLNEYPELFEIKKYLTLSECNTLHFSKSKIQARIISKKIFNKQIVNYFQPGTFYSYKDVKELLKDIFNKYTIAMTPKASLLEECIYITVKKDVKKINNRSIGGYFIEQNPLYYKLKK